VQLIEAVNEEPHWTQKFDREILDIFEIQSEIAEKVAGALHEYVLLREKPVETVRSTRNPEAYVSYLRGRQFWNKRTQEDLKRAIDFFEAALKIDATMPGLTPDWQTAMLPWRCLNLWRLPKPTESWRSRESSFARSPPG
jgi:hypothetical protein